MKKTETFNTRNETRVKPTDDAIEVWNFSKVRSRLVAFIVLIYGEKKINSERRKKNEKIVELKRSKTENSS